MTLNSVALGTDQHSLDVSALGYGAMSIAGAYGPIGEAESLDLLHQVVERGVTFIDTANIYGMGLSETLIGRFLPGRREHVTLASKCGIDPSGEAGARRINGRPEHIRQQIDLSLQRLRTDYLDLYYLHRPDPEVPIEESVGALSELVSAGKVRRIGLSEVTGDELRRAHQVHPITAVQSEWSLLARDVEHYVIPACVELGIGFVAFSPVARGLLADDFPADLQGEKDVRHRFPWFFPENRAHNVAAVETVRRVAAANGVPTAAVAIAWLHHRATQLGVHLTTIPGTRSVAHLDQLLAGAPADDRVVSFNETEIAQLQAVADQVQGARSFDPLWVSGGREGLIPV